MARNLGLRLLVLATAALTMGACNSGQASAPVAAPSTTAQQATKPVATSSALASPAQTPTPTSASSLPIVSDQWQDGDGYSFSLGMYAPKIEVAVDIQGAKPGMANITITVVSEGVATNLTANRKSPFVDVGFFPVWSASSDFCRLNTESTSVTNGFYGNQTVAKEYCRISNPSTVADAAMAQGGAAQQLGVSEARKVQARVKNALPIVVKEADVDRVVAAAKQPFAIAIGRIYDGQSKPNPTDCGMFDGRHGYYMSATSKPIPGCKPFK